MKKILLIGDNVPDGIGLAGSDTDQEGCRECVREPVDRILTTEIEMKYLLVNSSRAS